MEAYTILKMKEVFSLKPCNPFRTALNTAFRRTLAWTMLSCMSLLMYGPLKAQSLNYETIPTGSFVVDMGGTQSVSTLKAYGMLYNLMKGAQVPVKWCINPSKDKDGVDFTIGATAFKSGAFVITTPYRTAAVNAIITTWWVKVFPELPRLLMFSFRCTVRC